MSAYVPAIASAASSLVCDMSGNMAAVYVLFGFSMLFALVSTALVVAAYATSYWNVIHYDVELVRDIVSGDNATNVAVDTLRDGSVRIVWMDEMVTEASGMVTLLVPIRDGIWSICDEITDREAKMHEGYKMKDCYSYMLQEKPPYPVEESDEFHTVMRMQNSAISSSIVSLVLLISCVITGIVAVVNRQVIAVLMTGIMYILAGSFAIFTICIIEAKIHEQKKHSKGSFYTPRGYMSARVYSTGWSMMIAWIGAGFCIFTSLLWIALAQIAKRSPMMMSSDPAEDEIT